MYTQIILFSKFNQRQIRNELEMMNFKKDIKDEIEDNRNKYYKDVEIKAKIITNHSLICRSLQLFKLLFFLKPLTASSESQHFQLFSVLISNIFFLSF